MMGAGGEHLAAAAQRSPRDHSRQGEYDELHSDRGKLCFMSERVRAISRFYGQTCKSLLHDDVVGWF